MKNRRVAYVVFSAIFLLICATLFIQFLAYYEPKMNNEGIQLNDPILEILPRMDVSVAIFTITYGAILLYLILYFKVYERFAELMLAYAIMLMLRIGTLLLVPLKAPDSLVFLQDPFLNNLIYPGDIKNDLFFSGHTSLLCLLYFFSKRWVYLIAGCLLGVLLMMQRVHYSIDIIGAIPITFLIVKLVKKVTSTVLERD